MNVKIKIGIFFLAISMSSVLQASLYVNGVETSIEAGWATFSSWSIPKGNDAYTTGFDATESNMFDGNENHSQVTYYNLRTGAPLGCWSDDPSFTADWLLTLSHATKMEKIEMVIGSIEYYTTLEYTLIIDYETAGWVTIGTGAERSLQAGNVVDTWMLDADDNVERIKLTCSATTGGSHQKLDQMNIYAIPEPFTAAALCFGAVGFLRKRYWSIK